MEANGTGAGLGSCVAFLEDGSIVRQRQAPGRPAPDTLRVTFGIAAGSDGTSTTDSLGSEHKSDDKIVLIVDDPPATGGRSCARESAASAQDSAKASVPAQGNQPVAPGFTDAPDLTSCFYQQGQEGAVFVFDRRQDIANVDITAFGVVNPDGSFISVAPGTAAIPLRDDTAVQVQFSPAQTDDAIGCFAQAAAVRDFQDSSEGVGDAIPKVSGPTRWRATSRPSHRAPQPGPPARARPPAPPERPAPPARPRAARGPGSPSGGAAGRRTAQARPPASSGVRGRSAGGGRAAEAETGQGGACAGRARASAPTAGP